MSKLRYMCELLTTLVIAGTLYTGCFTPAVAQNTTCATRPVGDDSNACASTAFVQDQIAASTREQLTANRDYYVRTDGSDSNTGLTNTAGGAFLTVNKCMQVVQLDLDLNGKTVQCRIQGGTYTENLLQGQWIGYTGNGFSQFTMLCENGTVTLTSASASAVIFATQSGPPIRWKGCTTTNPAASGIQIEADDGALVVLDTHTFGATGAGGIQAQALLNSRFLYMAGTHTISGNSGVWAYATNNSQHIFQPGTTVALGAGRTMSTALVFLQSGSKFENTGLTFTGSLGGGSVPYNVDYSTFASITDNSILSGIGGAGAAVATGIAAGTGGTGFISYTLGDTLYADTTSTFAKLAGNITTAKQYLSQTGSGAVSAAPAWATIAGADITGAALSKTDDTNVTMTLGGTPTTALLRAASMTLGWTGQLSVARGGTGIGSGTSGGIPYFSSTSTIASSGVLASTALVLGGGAGAAPTTSTICSQSGTSFTCTSSSNSSPTFQFVNSAADASSAIMLYDKTRTGGDTQSGDTIAFIVARGFANGSMRNSAAIKSTQTGASSGSNIPTDINLQTSNTAGLLNQNLKFDSAAHTSITQATAPTISAGCNGAGSSITGNDTYGTVTGQTAAATTCTVTFGTAFAATPHCVASGLSSPLTGVITPSTTTLVVNFGSTANYKFTYICFGA